MISRGQKPRSKMYSLSRRGRVMTYAAKGHQTLSFSGSLAAGTSLENLKGERMSGSREVTSSLEGSEKRPSKPQQEPWSFQDQGSAERPKARNLHP